MVLIRPRAALGRRARTTTTMSGNERTMMFEMPAAEQGRLVGFEGSVKGRVFPLSSGTFIIGRGETCDMPLKDPGVSRQHAKIVAEGEQYILLDMESRNGTFVNGSPTRKAALQEGDEVRICAAAFRFTFLQIGPSASAPPMGAMDDHTAETDYDVDGATDPSRSREGTVPTVDQARIRPSAVPTTTGNAVRRPPPRDAREASAQRQAPVANVAPGSGDSGQVGQELRMLKIVVIVALVTALVAVGAAVGVVMVVRKPNKPVIVEKVVEKPIVVEKIVEKPVAVVDAGVAASESSDAGTVVAQADTPIDKPIDKPDVVKPKTDKPDVVKPKTDDKPQPSEWLPARAGAELVRAPAAGAVTEVVATGEVALGAPLLVVDGKPLKAPASGAVSGVPKVGDNVRKGQIVARIAEPRVRADVPAAFLKRAKKGAKVELQLDGGGTKTTTIVDVSGATVFVDGGGATVNAVRFP
jgi:predicted component of type VI protein secretion system